MAEYLSQSEANALLEMEKHAEAGASYRFPAKGERLSIPLLSADEKENFHVDVNRRSIALYKCTFNGRTRGNVILARLDLNGSPHRNPDGEEIDCLTCISIGRATVTNGPIRCLMEFFQTSPT